MSGFFAADLNSYVKMALQLVQNLPERRVDERQASVDPIAASAVTAGEIRTALRYGANRAAGQEGAKGGVRRLRLPPRDL